MAKKLIELSVTDIILQADAETIRQALEARIQIDDLLLKREEAYRQINDLEMQIEALVGEEGAFVYPAPPEPIAGFNKPVPASRPITPKPKPAPEKPEQPKKDEVTNEPDDSIATPEDEEATD
jgi:hypothetical protein